MRRTLLIGLAALATTACDPTGGGSGAATEEGVRGPGSATDLVEQMVQRGRLPQRDYVCRLTGGGDDEPYGTLGLANDRYTLITKGGGREEGSMTLNEQGGIVWEGDLGRIDDDRRVSNARINSEGATLSLTFDVSPELGGHRQMICTAEA